MLRHWSGEFFCLEECCVNLLKLLLDILLEHNFYPRESQLIRYKLAHAVLIAILTLVRGEIGRIEARHATVQARIRLRSAARRAVRFREISGLFLLQRRRVQLEELNDILHAGEPDEIGQVASGTAPELMVSEQVDTVTNRSTGPYRAWVSRQSRVNQAVRGEDGRFVHGSAAPYKDLTGADLGDLVGAAASMDFSNANTANAKKRKKKSDIDLHIGSCFNQLAVMHKQASVDELADGVCLALVPYNDGRPTDVATPSQALVMHTDVVFANELEQI